MALVSEGKVFKYRQTALFCWKMRKQHEVTLSTCEAELMTLAAAAQEVNP